MNDDLANAVADLSKLIASHNKHMSGLQCRVIALELLAKELERLVMAPEPARTKISFEIAGFMEDEDTGRASGIWVNENGHARLVSPEAFLADYCLGAQKNDG